MRWRAMFGLKMFGLLVLLAGAVLLFVCPRAVRQLHVRYRAYQYLGKKKRSSFWRVTDAELLQAIERRASDLSTSGAMLTRKFDLRVSWWSGEILVRAGEAMLELINACKYGHADWYHKKVGVVCDEAISVSKIDRLSPELRFELEMWAKNVREWAYVCRTLTGDLVLGGALEKTSVVQKSWGQQS